MEWWVITLISVGSFAVLCAFYRPFFKRFIDIASSLIGLILVGIPMIVTAVFVRCTLGAPVLFKQTRIGKNQKEFTIYKFRTMTDAKDELGNFLPDAARFTTAGKILRKLSLDEWPQLFNVLKGDLSLIGPRPMILKQLPSNPNVRGKRFAVRPGITGWAQVSGRVDISFEKRFEYDVKYERYLSLFLDAWIVLRTFWVLLTALFRRCKSQRNQDDLDILMGTIEYERRIGVRHYRRDKVLIVGDSYERLCDGYRALITELNHCGDIPIVAVPFEQDERGLERDCTRLISLPAYGKDREIRYADVAKLIRKHRPDKVLFITTENHKIGSVAARRCKIPYFAVFDEKDTSPASSDAQLLQDVLGNVHRARKIFVASDRLIGILEKYGLPSRSDVIVLGEEGKVHPETLELTGRG